MSLAKQVIVFSQSVSTPRYRPWKVIWTLKRQTINDSSRWTLLCSFLRLSYLKLTSTAVACEPQTHFRRERSDDRKCVCGSQATTTVVSSSFHTAFVFARSGEGGGDQINVFQGAPVFLYSVSFPLHDVRQYQHFCGLVACPASQFTSRKGHSTKTALSKIGSKRIFGNFIKLLS